MSVADNPRRALTGRQESAQVQAALADLFLRVAALEANQRRLAAATGHEDLIAEPERATGDADKDELLERAQETIEAEDAKNRYVDSLNRWAEQRAMQLATPRDLTPPQFNPHADQDEAKKRWYARLPK